MSMKENAPRLYTEICDVLGIGPEYGEDPETFVPALKQILALIDPLVNLAEESVMVIDYVAESQDTADHLAEGFLRITGRTCRRSD